MDTEIESINNQSEEVAVAAAAAAASIMMGLIEQEAEDEDCAGANGEEEEEQEQEPKAKQKRRSYPRPKNMESAWGQWLRKLKELQSSEGGLDEDCREARQFVVAFRVSYQMFLGIVEAVAPALPTAAHDVPWPGVHSGGIEGAFSVHGAFCTCLLYTSDAADE